MEEPDIGAYLKACLAEAFPRWERGDSLMGVLGPYLRLLLAIVSGLTAGFVAMATIAQVGLLLFAVSMILWAPYSVWRKSQLEVGKLSDKLAHLAYGRASLDVVPRLVREAMYLEVTNKGEQGELEAQIELLMGQPQGVTRPPNPYPGYWEGAMSDHVLLKEGFSDKLVLGRLEARYPAASFEMTFFNRAMGACEQYRSTSWLWPDPEGQTIPASFHLRVTISSVPRMPAGPFVREYFIEGKGKGAAVEFSAL